MNCLNTPETTRRNTFIQLSIETKMSAFAIEKDWWVTRTLDIIFQMDIAKPFQEHIEPPPKTIQGVLF